MEKLASCRRRSIRSNRIRDAALHTPTIPNRKHVQRSQLIACAVFGTGQFADRIESEISNDIVSIGVLDCIENEIRSYLSCVR